MAGAPRTLRRKCRLITPLYRCVAVLFAELREERFQYLDLGRERQTGICHVPRQYNGVLPRIYETGGDFKTLFGGLGIRLGHFRGKRAKPAAGEIRGAVDVLRDEVYRSGRIARLGKVARDRYRHGGNLTGVF